MDEIKAFADQVLSQFKLDGVDTPGYLRPVNMAFTRFGLVSFEALADKVAGVKLWGLVMVVCR